MFDSIKTRLIAMSIGVVLLTLCIATVANYLIVRNPTPPTQVLRDLDAPRWPVFLLLLTAYRPRARSA